MIKRLTITMGLLAVFFGALFGWKNYDARRQQAQILAAGPPVATVSTANVRIDDWPAELETVGTLQSGQSVNVSAQLDGQITGLFFDSGDEVAAGKLLAQQYVADDRAQLKALEADLRLAEIELGRVEKLVRDRLIPQSELDAARSKLDRVSAQIENIEALIGKKSIRAPFAGRLGIRQVNLGQYLEAGDALVLLESLDRLYADFRLPQRAFRAVHVGQTVRVTVDAWTGELFSGEIVAIEPLVDPATRNMLLRAVLANPDGRLRPGMFGEIRVRLPLRKDIVMVPQAAVTFSPYGSSVFVVEPGPQPMVRNTFVSTGEARGDLIEITGGLDAGQQVVTSGQIKLRDGARVQIDNSVPVSARAELTPDES